MSIIIFVLLILLAFIGLWGWYPRTPAGPYSHGPVAFVVLLVIILALFAFKMWGWPQ
jgi:membrane protein YdbS with pleckstrin-like domain